MSTVAPFAPSEFHDLGLCQQERSLASKNSCKEIKEAMRADWDENYNTYTVGLWKGARKLGQHSKVQQTKGISSHEEDGRPLCKLSTFQFESIHRFKA